MGESYIPYLMAEGPVGTLELNIQLSEVLGNFTLSDASNSKARTYSFTNSHTE